jgi:hypothetical protein
LLVPTSQYDTADPGKRLSSKEKSGAGWTGRRIGFQA